MHVNVKLKIKKNNKDEQKICFKVSITVECW